MKQLLEFIKQAYARFTAPTPQFWKDMQRNLGKLAVMFVALGAVYEAAPAGYLPEIVIRIITYAGIACGAGIAIAQFACNDKPQGDA